MATSTTGKTEAPGAPNTLSKDTISQALPPSHILQDGRSIYLPEPSDKERSKFLERSIVRHELLADLKQQKDKAEKQQQEKQEATKDSTEPKIHPLAIASAKLQTNGIAELSKAINLANLVSTDEYFSFANIVDPSLEESASTAVSTASNDKSSLARTVHEEQALRATYIGKRKRAQFESAAEALARHGRRLAASITAQTVVDERLRQLRPQWRLAAPEHGTRAKPHAVRPGEVVAVDVDVYDRDRTGGDSGEQASTKRAGRIARRVPRYATVELKDDYKVKQDLEEWKRRHEITKDEEDKMDVDTEEPTTLPAAVSKTRAEPFAMADPSLGNMDVDFDPEKVPMLSLQFDIDKPSTGFKQSARLTPLTETDSTTQSDEAGIVSLQHSLFCASLFESIRKELVPDNDGTVGGGSMRQTVWLPSETDELYLPVPTFMAGGDTMDGGAGRLAVVYCHEGEVKVQLDAEYALTVKLVEAEQSTDNNGDSDAMDTTATNADSGSRTQEQLHALCRALLVHAQDVYHAYNMRSKMSSADSEKPSVLKRKPKESVPPPRILEKCVSLGAKLLFEPKVRNAISRIRVWLESTMDSTDKLVVEWLPLSVFDAHSKLALSFKSLCIDMTIDRDSMTLTSFGEDGSTFRQVTFRSDKEFEMFLKLKLHQEATRPVADDDATPTRAHSR